MACESSGIDSNEHFHDTVKKIQAAKGAMEKITEKGMFRGAKTVTKHCYITAQDINLMLIQEVNNGLR